MGAKFMQLVPEAANQALTLTLKLLLSLLLASMQVRRGKLELNYAGLSLDSPE